jgi:hypothetical protein
MAGWPCDTHNGETADRGDGTASLPIAYQLYLPEEWARDAARRAKAHVPENKAFQTKPEIALKQIKLMSAGAAYDGSNIWTPGRAAGASRTLGLNGIRPGSRPR